MKAATVRIQKHLPYALCGEGGGGGKARNQMDTAKRLNQSKTLFFCLCAGIFVILMVCNFWTGMAVDDYTYSFSFSTGERIASVPDIFPSLRAHYGTMNGRLLAHFFVQLFLLLPHAVFKVLNSGMFLLQVLLIYRICKPSGAPNNLVFASVFGAIWVFEPAFGQVNLWQDGACNYLWSAVFGLAFLIPIIRRLRYREAEKAAGWRALYPMLGFAAGGYLENLSAAVIVMAFLLLLLLRFYKKERVPARFILGLAAAAAAYALMAAAPGEMKNKIVKGGLWFYRQNFIKTLETYRTFWLPAAAFIVLFVLAASIERNKDALILSALFALGSLCANFIFIFSSYYPARASSGSALFLIAADAILAAELFATKYDALLISSALVLLAVTFYDGGIGINDIYTTHSAMQANIASLRQFKAEGKLDVSLPMIHPSTRYSLVQSLKYLDTKDPSSWPNAAMAKYYGVRTIIGKP